MNNFHEQLSWRSGPTEERMKFHLSQNTLVSLDKGLNLKTFVTNALTHFGTWLNLSETISKKHLITWAFVEYLETA